MAQISYGTITITDTNDIESIIVEYARNQSTSSAPTSGWSTTRPTWAQGYYIWQRTRTHKAGTSADSDIYGTAVCITGSTGQTGGTGAAGRSLTNTITQYTTATNSATITQSNMGNYTWNSNVPSYSSSTPAYWVRVTNTYSNPSSTEYIIYKDNGLTDVVAKSVEANNNAAIANSIAQHANENAQGAIAQAVEAQYQTEALDAKLKQFFWPGDSNYPGAYAVSGIDGTTLDPESISTYGYNVALKPASISVGYNNIKVILIDGSNPSLKFYAPSKTTQATNPSMTLTSSALTFNKIGTANKTVELTSSALNFYGSSTSAADATLTSTGLKLVKGGLEAGTKNTTNYIYVWSTDDSTNHKLTINNHEASDWRIIAGNKFGVDKAGNLYASNANISGVIKVDSGSNVYTTDDVNPLKIGGRNLLLSTGTANTWTISLNSSNYQAHDCYQTCLPIPSLFAVDDLVTISFDWSTNGTSGNFHIECGKVTPYTWGTVVNAIGTRSATSNYIDITSSNTSGHVSVTFKITSSQTSAAETLQWLRIRVDGADMASKTFTVSNAKAERGNKATDWTLAPEDESGTNLLSYPYIRDVLSGSPYTTNGVTFTLNKDGTVTATGTATANTWYQFTSSIYPNNPNGAFCLPAGTYTISGCPSGGASSTYRLQFAAYSLSDGTTSLNTLAIDYGNGATVTTTQAALIRFEVGILNGTACPSSGLTFKPMLESGTIAHPFSSPSATEAASQSATKYVTRIDDAGIFISPGNQSPTSTAAGNSVKINGNGLYIYKDGIEQAYFIGTAAAIGRTGQGRVIIKNDGLHVYDYIDSTQRDIAYFGSTARVGLSSGSHFVMNAASLQAFNASGTKYFEVSASGITFGSNTAATTTQVSNAKGNFTILWNRSSFTETDPNNGEAYICKLDALTNTPSDANGTVMWNGTNRTITKQMVNPNTIAPYNIPIYIVCRLSSATATTGTNYIVWYNSGWKYAALPTPSAVGGTWTWVDTTDIILGKFVEPSSEGAFTECEIYNPPWSSKQITSITTTSVSAAKTATNYITQINNNGGIWVTPSDKKPTDTATGAGATGTRINGDGMQIFKDGVSIAKYGDSATIGKDEQAKVVIQPSGVDMYGYADNTQAQICHMGYASGNAGNETTAYAPYFTFGKRRTPTNFGIYSLAEGYRCDAKGTYSHAEGDYTIATGYASHAEGTWDLSGDNSSYFYTTAAGRASHAGGIGTQANGYASFAHGTKLIADGSHQAVFGKNNVNNSTDLFIIGNGSSDTSRSNALTVSKAGRVTAKAYASSFALTATSTAQNHASVLNYWFIDNKQTIERNALLVPYSSAYGNGSLYMGYVLSGYDSTPYGGFFVAHYADAKYVGIQNGEFIEYSLTKTLSSSRRLKKNIQSITSKEAEKIYGLDVISFDYKEGHEGGKTNQIGLIAEDCNEIIPDAVYKPTENPEDSIWSIDFTKFIPYLIKCVQIQKKEIDELRRKINEAPNEG